MAEVNEQFPGEKELQDLIERVKRAQLIYANFPQEKVDEIFRAASIAANNARISLAQDAVEETGMGIIEDKVIKNHFAAEYIFHKYKDDKTCGIIEDDPGFGIKKIAEPKGVICGIIPTTNPTSTAIFKSLIALKTRNAIICSQCWSTGGHHRMDRRAEHGEDELPDAPPACESHTCNRWSWNGQIRILLR